MELDNSICKKETTPHSVNILGEKRWVNLIIWMALLSGQIACVSQGKYDAVLRENQTLQGEMVGLQSTLKATQQRTRTEKPHALIALDNRQLASLLAKLVGDLEGRAGQWKIRYHEIPMIVLTSEKHNRMRIMAIVSESSTIEPALMQKLMEANFDKALDARYALFQGKLWSTYLHPLSTLTEIELVAALHQVANLVKTYGTTYSSSHLQFQ